MKQIISMFLMVFALVFTSSSSYATYDSDEMIVFTNEQQGDYITDFSYCVIISKRMSMMNDQYMREKGGVIFDRLTEDKDISEMLTLITSNHDNEWVSDYMDKGSSIAFKILDSNLVFNNKEYIKFCEDFIDQ